MLDREPADADLVRAMGSGDLKAFEVFYRRFEAPIYRTALAMTRDIMTAEEVVTDTFVRAYAARARLDACRPPLPYLQRVAINLSLNVLRRRRLGLVPLDDPALGYRTDPAASPEATAEQRELARVLTHGIACLPPRFRAVVTLRYVDGYDLAEIAGILGWPLGTVKSRLHHALRQLRGELHSVLEREAVPDGAIAGRDARAEGTP